MAAASRADRDRPIEIGRLEIGLLEKGEAFLQPLQALAVQLQSRRDGGLGTLEPAGLVIEGLGFSDLITARSGKAQQGIGLLPEGRSAGDRRQPVLLPADLSLLPRHGGQEPLTQAVTALGQAALAQQEAVVAGQAPVDGQGLSTIISIPRGRPSLGPAAHRRRPSPSTGSHGHRPGEGRTAPPPGR